MITPFSAGFFFFKSNFHLQAISISINVFGFKARRNTSTEKLELRLGNGRREERGREEGGMEGGKKVGSKERGKEWREEWKEGRMRRYTEGGG